MEKFMTFLPFHNAHFYCTSMNIEDLMDSDSQSFYYLSCCCEVCHHQALPGSCCPAGSVTSGEGLWKKHICFCTVALKVKTQQHFLGGCFLLFQIIEHLLRSFLPFQQSQIDTFCPILLQQMRNTVFFMQSGNIHLRQSVSVE